MVVFDIGYVSKNMYDLSGEQKINYGKNICSRRGGKTSSVSKKRNNKKIIYEFDGEFIYSVVNRPQFANILDKIVKNAFVLIAFLENRVVEFSAFYINDFISNTVYISLIAIEKKYQGNHIGTMMIDYIKFMAKINGFDKIRLEVDNVNVDGIEFYKRNSFVYETIASKNSIYMVCWLQYLLKFT